MRISFIGDIIPHTAVIKSCEADSGYDYSGIFAYVKKLLANSDYVVASAEFAIKLSDEIKFIGDKTIVGQPGVQQQFPYVVVPNGANPFILISTPTDLVEQMVSDLNISQVTVANNHALDNGLFCFQEGVKFFRDLGCDVNGLAGENGVIKTLGGKKIGFYNYTNFIKGIPGMNSRTLIKTGTNEAELTALRNKVDYLFVLPHWGREYSKTETPAQTRAIAICNRVGVDRIIGTHPHIVYERSIGNFLSGRIDGRSRLGVIHHVDIDEDGLHDSIEYVWSAFRGTVHDYACVVPVQDVLDGKIEMEFNEKNMMTLIYNRYKLD